MRFLSFIDSWKSGGSNLVTDNEYFFDKKVNLVWPEEVMKNILLSFHRCESDDIMGRFGGRLFYSQLAINRRSWVGRKE